MFSFLLAYYVASHIRFTSIDISKIAGTLNTDQNVYVVERSKNEMNFIDESQSNVNKNTKQNH